MADLDTTAENPLDELTRLFRRYQDQKGRGRSGGVEARVLTNLAFWFGEHSAYHKLGTLLVPTAKDNQIYLVLNFVRRRMNKLLGRFMSINGAYRASPSKREAKALANAEVATKMTRALDQKVDQEQRSWEIWWWMMVSGVAFEHTPWIPDDSFEPVEKTDENGELVFKTVFDVPGLGLDQEVPGGLRDSLIEQKAALPEHFEPVLEGAPQGDVGSTIYGPLNVFMDHSVRDLKKLAPDQMVMIAEAKSIDWIQSQDFFTDTENLQPVRQIDIVKSNILHEGDALSNMNLRDMLPIISGEVDAEANVVVFIQAYGPPSATRPHGRYVCFVPDQAILLDREIPYEDREIPITDYHWAPITTSFWTTDFVTDLIVPNKFINKRFSQLAEYANAFLKAPRLLGQGLKPGDIPSDYPGYVIDGLGENGEPLVKHMDPPQVGSWFLRTNEDMMKIMNDLAGGADLFQEGKFPGQFRGSMSIPMLQEILDSEWGPLFLHVGLQMARVKKLRLNRVKQFYPPIRTLHYMGKENRDEVLEFHTEEILRSGVEYNISVDPGSLLPELASMREARVSERLQSPLGILYIDKRTGKIDATKVAADLHWGEDEGRVEREAQYRKLAREFISRLNRGELLQIVMPFWDHYAMMDEYESAMATTEFLESSPEIQKAFLLIYDKHREFLAAQQEAATQAVMAKQVQGAVAQATQQAAAQAAAAAVQPAIDAVRAQAEASSLAPETSPELLALLAKVSQGRGGGQGIV